jgi:uncharacterized CHY-type Zn-finger protein
VRCWTHRCYHGNTRHETVVLTMYLIFQGFLRSFKGWDRYQRHTFIADNFSDPKVVCGVPLLSATEAVGMHSLACWNMHKV